MVQLSTHAEVETAVGIISSCLHTQLSSKQATVNEVANIIGELLDNVASHARGAGFSALQVYNKPSRIEFAVVDCGVGLLEKVRLVEPTIETHANAIYKCFQMGFTTARPPADDFAQRMPQDSISSPFGPSVSLLHDANNHQGLGLWSLAQVVGRLQGELWAMTGDAELHVGQDFRQEYRRSRIDWQGVAIEVTLPVEETFVRPPHVDDESIARRFKI